MHTIKRYIKAALERAHFLSAETFLRLAYRLTTGRRLNLTHPATINDKLNWLKLHGNMGRFAPLVDKLVVRAFVARTIGEEYLVPLLGAARNPRHIMWDALPGQFVVKCTHGSHCGIVCRDKRTFDVDTAIKRLGKWMRTNWYWYGREPPYRHLCPQVIVEPLLGDGVTPPIDYKFMCFGGEPEIVQVHRKASYAPGARTTIDFYTAYGKRMDCRKAGYPTSSTHDLDHKALMTMLPIARTLARAIDTPYVRVDLYSIDQRVYFGEITFFDSAALRDYEPPKANAELGAMIDLSTIKGVRQC